MQQEEKFDCWGIVEVMGHKRFAGHITEQTIAGAALVRIDVPETLRSEPQDGNDPAAPRPGYTKLVGVASIYCITPTTEELARKAAQELGHTDAMPVYIPEPRLLTATSSTDFDTDDDQDDGDPWGDDE